MCFNSVLALTLNVCMFLLLSLLRNLRLPNFDLSPHVHCSICMFQHPFSLPFQCLTKKRMDSLLFVLIPSSASLFLSHHPAKYNPRLHVPLMCYQGCLSHILLPFSVVLMHHCTPLHICLNTTYSCLFVPAPSFKFTTFCGWLCLHLWAARIP